MQDYFLLNESPWDFKTFRSFGMELGPIPCKVNSCSTVYFESCSGVLIPAFSIALLAGAATLESISSTGFFRSSQMGHTGNHCSCNIGAHSGRSLNFSPRLPFCYPCSTCLLSNSLILSSCSSNARCAWNTCRSM